MVSLDVAKWQLGLFEGWLSAAVGSVRLRHLLGVCDGSDDDGGDWHLGSHSSPVPTGSPPIGMDSQETRYAWYDSLVWHVPRIL